MQYRELRTYTSLWGMEKRLYKFYDINLPYPVSVKQIGFFLGTLAPWVFLLNLIGVPFSNPWYVVWIVPPFAVAYYANRPVAEGKQLFDYILSQVGYVIKGRQYNGLKPAVGSSKTKTTYQVQCLAWSENETRKANRKKKTQQGSKGKTQNRKSFFGKKKRNTHPHSAEKTHNTPKSKKTTHTKKVKQRT